MEEEIIKLKKIIQEKNLKEKSIENKNAKIVKEKKRKEEKNKFKEKYNIRKVITFSGNYKSGKTTLALIFSQMLIKKKYKVLLIDADFEKQDLSILLKNKKTKNISKNKNKNKKIDSINIIYNKLTNKKNKIYFYKIKKSIIKLDNRNLYYFCKSENIINKKEKIYLFFEYVKKEFNFILIDLSKNNKRIINREIIKNSNINFIIMESNILGLKEVQQLLNLYIKEWNFIQKNFYLILNKKSLMSINKNLISRNIPLKNKIYEIRENKVFRLFNCQSISNIVIENNKMIKNEIDNIIKNIIFNEK